MNTNLKSEALAPEMPTAAALFEHARTGKYSVFTTAKIMAAATDETICGWTALHDLVAFNHNLVGFIFSDLLSVEDKYGRTPLHLAVQNGNYPKGTTAHKLAEIMSKEAYSLLHEAARNGFPPPGTTLADLANAVGQSWVDSSP